MVADEAHPFVEIDARPSGFIEVCRYLSMLAELKMRNAQISGTLRENTTKICHLNGINAKTFQ